MKKIVSKIAVAKTPSQRGTWVYKALRSVILICECGNKYIATRGNQTVCINCVSGKTLR